MRSLGWYPHSEIQLLSSVGALPFSIAAAFLLAVCVCVSYFVCVAEGQCKVFLPMISDTFVPAPGNYISRVMLSLTAVGVAVVVLMDYFSFLRACGRYNASKTFEGLPA